MIEKLNDIFDPEQFKKWYDSLPDDEPAGCTHCGALAGCCKAYPNCPGNLEWKGELK